MSTLAPEVAYLRLRGIVDASLTEHIKATYRDGRVWLPWFDAENNEIYSSGRSVNGVEPKYKNKPGPKPPLFATPSAWQAPEVVLVEGQFDALAAAQAGSPAFATTTSSLSEAAVPILSSKRRVILVCDRDEAGESWKQDCVEKLAHLVDLYEAIVPEPNKDLAEVAENAVEPGEAVFDVLESREPFRATPFVVWEDFWRKDRTESEWLYEPILAKGRGHAFYATHKTGKSLFMLYFCARLATQGDTVVIYLDYEMGEDDLYDRLDKMGYGAHSDLALLRYALLPFFPPLNTPEGSAELLKWVDGLRMRWPDKDFLVVVDTIARAVVGAEKDAETIQEFYRHTGIALKQRGITWARLDHQGKDPTLGQRGTSAKGDDVDVIWRVARTDDGVSLKSVARMGWIPPEVKFHYQDEPTRLIEVDEAWPAGTKDLVEQLDSLDVDLAWGKRKVREYLKTQNLSAPENLLVKAMKFRRMRPIRPTLEGA